MTYAHQNGNYLNLDDLPSVIKYLQDHQDDNGRGMLVIHELGVQVDYDLYEGKVGPIEFIHHSGDIETVYSENIEHVLQEQISKQVKDAIALLAKLYLLQRLLELGDPEINKIIKSRHFEGVQ